MRLLPLCSLLVSGFLFFALVQTARAIQADPPATRPRYPVIASQLPPLPTGPGIGICEPRTKNAPALADFGAGCSRWLQFALGTNMQLGQMPRWDSQLRVCKEMKLPDMRLSLAQAAGLAKRAGYTHMAVGEITGVADRCTLTYELYVMPGKKAVGPALKATGTQVQVIAALPGLACQFLQRLKVAPASLSEAPGLTTAEMQQIGRYRWMDGGKVAAEEQTQMAGLAERQPLAGLLVYMRRPPNYPKTLEAIGQRLLSQAPKNLLVRSQLLMLNPLFPPAFRSEFDRSMPTGSNNYSVAFWQFNSARTLQERLTRAEYMVRCAPRNPVAWSQLASLYGDASEQVRRGKLASMVTQEEWDVLGKLYERSVELGKKATTIDPEYGRAWAELAVMATFAGDTDLADTALWKAMRLDKGAPRPYTWGLQMYQPKWMGDRDKLVKVARLAAAEPSFTPDAAYSVYESLRDVGFAAEAKTVLDRAMQGYRDAAQNNPDNPEAHRMLGYRLYQQKKYDEATAALQTALKLDPEFSNAHYNLGLVYADTRRYELAVAEHREALKLTPEAYLTRTELGQALINLNRLDEAEAEFRKVLEKQPDIYRSVYGLGWVLIHKKQYEESLKMFEAASALRPEASDPYMQLCWLYTNKEQYDKAIQYGERSIYFGPKSYYAHLYLGTAYFQKEQYDESAEQYQKAIELSPKDVYARLRLAKIHLKQSKKEEARALLQEILRLEPNGNVAKEAQDLLTQNP